MTWIGTSSFTAHMVCYLLLGMLAPLLVVAAAPVTLLLRALPADRGRFVTRVLRSPGVRVASHPIVAAALNSGGLWLLYATDLYLRMHSSPVIHAMVHAHVFLAGLEFTAAIVGVDPNPHRASFTVRGTVLVAFIASHSVLAKWLYANPRTGVDPKDGEVGAQVMYYGGDVVDVTLIVLLFASRYAVGRPAVHGEGRPRGPAGPRHAPSPPGAAPGHERGRSAA